MGKRKSTFDKFFDILFEMTGFSWKAGIVICVVFSGFTAKLIFWAVAQQSIFEESSGAQFLMLQNILWVHYLLPLVMGVITALFIRKTYITYAQQDDIFL
jgi:hypothetical protein